MTETRLEFLERWHQDTHEIELVWMTLLYMPKHPRDCYGIGYTHAEIKAVLSALTVQRLEIESEIKQSKENLR